MGKVKRGQVGSVRFDGAGQIDCDKLANCTPEQWRWLSIPGSRLVLNPGPNSGESAAPMGIDLPLNLGYWVNNTLQQLPAIVTLRDANVQQSIEANTCWYPHQLTFDARFAVGALQLHGTDFLYDENTVVRILEARANAPNPGVQFTGVLPVPNVQYDTLRDLTVVQREGYHYAMGFVILNDDEMKPRQLLQQPIIVSDRWSLNVTADNVAVVVAISNSDEGPERAAQRALKALNDPSMRAALASRKRYWNELLARVPAPQHWGVQGVEAKGVTPGMHTLHYYAAWMFLIANVLPPAPEVGYPFPQTPCGKPSGWNEGSGGARPSASWESFFGQQFLAYVMPDEAWRAFEGIMTEVTTEGMLAGESLPSRKAQTAWVLYSLTGNRERLEGVYEALKRYLIWREQNPRWIYGEHDYPDEKDAEFVVSHLIDVRYAVRIARAIGREDDCAMWNEMTAREVANYRAWFFPPGRDEPEGFYFAGTQEHAGAGRPEKEPSYILSGLHLTDLPEDIVKRLKAYFKAHFRPDERAAGFGTLKYPDTSFMAYGLLEQGMRGEATAFVNAVIRDTVLTRDFCEVISAETLDPVGTRPTLFTPCQLIDFTWLANGVRMDQGAAQAM